MNVTFALLTLALLALWMNPAALPARVGSWSWAIFFVGALIAALVSGIVHPSALPGIAAFGLAVAAFARPKLPRGARFFASAAIIVLAAGLFTHRWPGFDNPRVIDGVRFTPDALPFRLHFNFDKALVGLFILAWLHPRIVRAAEWRAMFVRFLPVAAVTLTALLLLSSLLGYVRFAPKLPAETPLFLWVNLCFTCVAEEALFRGFIQARLATRWQQVSHGPWLALGVGAVLFGIAHAGGGPAYVLLSTIAGFGYGCAYLRTGGRIEASILTHFAVNAIHFIGFTYPALQHVSR